MRVIVTDSLSFHYFSHLAFFTPEIFAYVYMVYIYIRNKKIRNFTP